VRIVIGNELNQVIKSEGSLQREKRKNTYTLIDDELQK